jgi:hypothetical protein
MLKFLLRRWISQYAVELQMEAHRLQREVYFLRGELSKLMHLHANHEHALNHEKRMSRAHFFVALHVIGSDEETRRRRDKIFKELEKHENAYKARLTKGITL